MNIPKLVTILGAAALFAGCSGGGGSSPSPNLTNTTNPTYTNVGTGLAISVDLSAVKAASNRRSPQQITADVNYLAVTIDSSATQYFKLTGTQTTGCTGTSPSYSCTFATTAGSHTVAVTTNSAGDSSHIVAYSVPQTGVSVTLAATTGLTFTLTPVATAFSGSYAAGSGASKSFPEDGSTTPTISNTVNVLALNNDLIGTPLDTTNLFGAVTVTTSPVYTVTGATQSSASATAGSYTASPYTFTYNGAQVSGDALAVQAAYTKNTGNSSATEAAYNNAVGSITSAATVFTVPLTRLELPAAANPSGATVNGTTFDSTSSWYYYPPNSGSGSYTIDGQSSQPNGDATSIVVFNGSTASATFVLNVTATNDVSKAVTGSGSCDTAGTGSAAIYAIGSVTGSPNGVTPITIDFPGHSGQTAKCQLILTNGTFSTLLEKIEVYPTSNGSIDISTQSVHRS